MHKSKVTTTEGIPNSLLNSNGKRERIKGLRGELDELIRLDSGIV